MSSICFIRNLLVAVEGLENSDGALDFGLDLAEKFGATVMMLDTNKLPALGGFRLEPKTVSGDSVLVFAKDL